MQLMPLHLRHLWNLCDVLWEVPSGLPHAPILYASSRCVIECAFVHQGRSTTLHMCRPCVLLKALCANKHILDGLVISLSNENMLRQPSDLQRKLPAMLGDYAHCLAHESLTQSPSKTHRLTLMLPLAAATTPPTKILEVNFGWAGSEMSYCTMSPRSQLLKYRNLSSREMRMSVISGGTSGRIQPSTFSHGCLMATCVSHLPDWPCSGPSTRKDNRPPCVLADGVYMMQLTMQALQRQS